MVNLLPSSRQLQIIAVDAEVQVRERSGRYFRVRVPTISQSGKTATAIAMDHAATHSLRSPSSNVCIVSRRAIKILMLISCQITNVPYRRVHLRNNLKGTRGLGHVHRIETRTSLQSRSEACSADSRHGSRADVSYFLPGRESWADAVKVDPSGAWGAA